MAVLLFVAHLNEGANHDEMHKLFGRMPNNGETQGSSGDEQGDDENLHDTCEIVNTTGLFLNKDPNLKVNLEGQITVFFRLVPYHLYQNQVAM